MLGYMEDNGVRFSYCANCIDRQDFHLVEGIWLCDNCKKPLQTATQPAERMDKSLQLRDIYGTIVTGGDYG